MWVVFRDPQTNFHTLDKFIVGLVEHADILTFQTHLAELLGAKKQDVNLDSSYLQGFVYTNDVEYYVRKYTPLDITTLQTNTEFLTEQKRLGTPSILKVHVLERRNPCNTSQ